jgi:hypothetical protein
MSRVRKTKVAPDQPVAALAEYERWLDGLAAAQRRPFRRINGRLLRRLVIHIRHGGTVAEFRREYGIGDRSLARTYLRLPENLR